MEAAARRKADSVDALRRLRASTALLPPAALGRPPAILRVGTVGSS